MIAADLTPAEAAELDPSRVAAVLLAFGSPHAHNVILLRAKGIPVIVGAGPTVLSIPEGTIVAVDGGQGEFIVDPAQDVRQEFAERVATLARRQGHARARAAEPAVTRDAVTIPVGANVGSVDDARAAAAHGADLAGLVRTEFLFLGRQDAPDVEEQFAVYRKIAESLDGRRITLRTLDVGGDKPLEFLPSPAEANPYLGVRGIRLSLAHPDLLAEQLLAMVRLAQQTPVSVMFPMITTLDELFAARELLETAIGQAGGGGRPAGLQVGMMVEVPAAALKAAAFARHVDFLSIGTNDLTQYTLAADRNNDAVAPIGDTFDPGLLQLIRATCQGAAGKASVSVCGEFAADERAVAPLLGMGVDSLSVTPPAIPATKEAVRAVDTAEAQRLARKCSPATARHPCGRDCTGTEHGKVALRRQGDHSLAMVTASGSYRSTRHPTRLVRIPDDRQPRRPERRRWCRRSPQGHNRVRRHRLRCVPAEARNRVQAGAGLPGDATFAPGPLTDDGTGHGGGVGNGGSACANPAPNPAAAMLMAPISVALVAVRFSFICDSFDRCIHAVRGALVRIDPRARGTTP